MWGRLSSWEKGVQQWRGNGKGGGGRGGEEVGIR